MKRRFQGDAQVDVQRHGRNLIGQYHVDRVGCSGSTLAPGIYEISFDGSNFSSGAYFYKLKSGSHIQMKRMLLIVLILMLGSAGQILAQNIPAAFADIGYGARAMGMGGAHDTDHPA